MDSPQTPRKQLPFYGRHNSDLFTNSSTTSLHSSNNSSHLLLSNRSSVYAPNIERQLNSLVIEDDGTQEDTAELLQQTFDQLDVETQGHAALSHHTRPVSSFTTEASCRSRSSTTDEDHTSLTHRSLAHRDDNDSMQVDLMNVHFSAFTYPFAEQPVITGKTLTGFYIATPTSIRNYLDYPDASVLKDMILPYPFRVKEPVSQRLERLDSDSSFMAMNLQQQQQQLKKSSAIQDPPIQPSKRHSLALGQVDRIVRKNSMIKTDTLLKPQTSAPKSKQHRHSRTASIMSDRTQDIITWMPDQNTEWQDWTQQQQESETASSSETGMPLCLNIPWSNTESVHTGVYADSQLHPLDHTIKKMTALHDA
ncbi:hypothetical protein MUCCIDRAFT_116350 [Mucor lusitanicus CBS 277.49]|uniref:Uncharacterized protein n=1 Tax=Mucor lusitanicus CBS 277.49 TaxID=747725 RepID=A0A168GDA3_MUCCL|nr:hypothetical protein MUCCIDRAFT_116350 [Mucor lusitanicus CBS 277.49]